MKDRKQGSYEKKNSYTFLCVTWAFIHTASKLTLLLFVLQLLHKFLVGCMNGSTIKFLSKMKEILDNFLLPACTK